MMWYRKMKQKIRKIKNTSRRVKLIGLVSCIVVFAAIGTYSVLTSRAAAGLCSTSGVVGTATHTVNVPETAQYRLWVRMRTPDMGNTGNINGARIELAGANNQCFTVTTTSASAVSDWQWVNSSATASSTQHVTSSMPSGNYTVKILGLKAGVKVDKVLLLKLDNSCIPDSNRSAGREPGDNCTTPAPTVSFSANPTSVTSGTASTLTWTVSDATSCTASGASGWSGSKQFSGSQSTGNLTADRTYTLSCSGVGGTTSRQVTVTVTPVPPPTDTTPPSITFSIPGVSLGAATTSVTVRNQRSIVWEALSSDASGIKSLVLTVNDQAVTGNQITVGAQANGDYVLKAVATDNANNKTEKTLTIRLRHPDVNRSGQVNMSDIGIMTKSWGMNDPRYDLNLNNKVDISDIGLITKSWLSRD